MKQTFKSRPVLVSAKNHSVFGMVALLALVSSKYSPVLFKKHCLISSTVTLCLVASLLVVWSETLKFNSCFMSQVALKIWLCAELYIQNFQKSTSKGHLSFSALSGLYSCQLKVALNIDVELQQRLQNLSPNFRDLSLPIYLMYTRIG